MIRDGVERLLDAAGIDGGRYRAVLGLLCDGRWWTVADLVRESATSRRAVEALLREVAPERSGDRFRLPAEHIGACRSLLAGHDPGRVADPVAHLLPRHAEVVETMRRLIAGAPRGRHALDHVAATPETVARRALLLGARFWTPGARLLCVGDHDLTSLAVAMICPGVEVTVVDVDDRVLAYIDEQAGRLGVRVATRWADLRLGLSPSVRGWADLALTDPPYTPEGVGLFVARAVEGLRDHERGRVLLAYGVSERTPMLALKTQRALLDLNLACEAMFPDFNRYLGAEAIGSAADLYILRPTTKTAPAIAARAGRYGVAIYTRGPQSTESAPGGAAILDPAFEPDVLVGDWPKDAAPGAPRVRLSTWLAAPRARSVERAAIAVPAGLEAALPRLLLATRARQVRVHLAAAPRDLPAEPVAPVYRLTVHGAVVEAVRRPAGDPVVREIMDNAHGKVANAWREALTRAAGLTRRQARGLVAEIAPWALGATLLDLPAHHLAALPAAVRASLARPAPSDTPVARVSDGAGG